MEYLNIQIFSAGVKSQNAKMVDWKSPHLDVKYETRLLTFVNFLQELKRLERSKPHEL